MVAENAIETSNEKPLKSIKRAWWVVLIVYGFLGVYIWWSWAVTSKGMSLHEQVNLTLSILVYVTSIVLALFLFWTRRKSWIAILTSMMLISDMGKYGSQLFFYYMIHGGWGDLSKMNFEHSIAANILSLPFVFIAFTLIYATFLRFPDGEWIFPKARQVLFLWGIAFWLEAFYRLLSTHNVLATRDGILSIGFFLVGVGALQVFRYFRMPAGTKKQQVKWILIFWAGVALENLASYILTLWIIINYTAENYAVYLQVQPFLITINQVLYFGFVMSFGISIFRYRLWDIDFLIYKTVFYIILSGLLAGLFLASEAVIGFLIADRFGKPEASAWAAVLSALPVATAFTPLRQWLQARVDKRWKPEEVNFSDTFVEFQPEIREMFTTSRIIQLVSEQVKKQLNVDFSCVYLLGQDDLLHNAEPSQASEGHNLLTLEQDRLSQLQEGKVVVDDDGIPYSLLVPLMVPRARIPDFLGVIVLGRRLENKGYSTQILKNLEALGADAGKAIYLSKIQEQVNVAAPRQDLS